jgi:hypothetical protein
MIVVRWRKSGWERTGSERLWSDGQKSDCERAGKQNKRRSDGVAICISIHGILYSALRQAPELQTTQNDVESGSQFTSYDGLLAKIVRQLQLQRSASSQAAGMREQQIAATCERPRLHRFANSPDYKDARMA